MAVEAPAFTPVVGNPTHTVYYVLYHICEDNVKKLFNDLGPTRAKGSLTDLADRLDQSINADGSLKTTTTAGNWISDTGTLVRIGATQFSTDAGDLTGRYVAGARIGFNLSGTPAYGIVSTSAYTTVTTVTLTGSHVPTVITTVDCGMGPFSISHRIYDDNAAYYMELPTLGANDEFVGLGATQTLAAKTLTAPVLAGATRITGSMTASAATTVSCAGTANVASLNATTLAVVTSLTAGAATTVSCAGTLNATPTSGTVNLSAATVTLPTSQTLTTPTVADLTNMTHDHTSAAQGGALAAGGLSGSVVGCRVEYAGVASVTLAAGQFEVGSATYTVSAAQTVSGAGVFGPSSWFTVQFDQSVCNTNGIASNACFSIVSAATAAFDDDLQCYVTSGNDRCLGLIYSNASSQVEQFYCDSNRTWWFTNHRASTTVPKVLDTGASATTFTQITAPLPTSFGIRWSIYLFLYYIKAGTVPVASIAPGDGTGYTSSDRDYFTSVLGNGFTSGTIGTGHVWAQTDTSGQFWYYTLSSGTLKILMKAFNLPEGL